MKLQDMLFSVTYPIGDGGRVGDSFIGTRVDCAKWALARSGTQIKVVNWEGHPGRWPVLIESFLIDSSHHTGATVCAADEPRAKIAALELVASHLDLLHHDLTPNFLIAEALGDHFCREVTEVLEDTFFDLADPQVHKEVFAYERPSSGVSPGEFEKWKTARNFSYCERRKMIVEIAKIFSLSANQINQLELQLHTCAEVVLATSPEWAEKINEMTRFKNSAQSALSRYSSKRGDNDNLR